MCLVESKPAVKLATCTSTWLNRKPSKTTRIVCDIDQTTQPMNRHSASKVCDGTLVHFATFKVKDVEEQTAIFKAELQENDSDELILLHRVATLRLSIHRLVLFPRKEQERAGEICADILWTDTFVDTSARPSTVSFADLQLHCAPASVRLLETATFTHDEHVEEPMTIDDDIAMIGPSDSGSIIVYQPHWDSRLVRNTTSYIRTSSVHANSQGPAQSGHRILIFSNPPDPTEVMSNSGEDDSPSDMVSCMSNQDVSQSAVRQLLNLNESQRVALSRNLIVENDAAQTTVVTRRFIAHGDPDNEEEALGERLVITECRIVESPVRMVAYCILTDYLQHGAETDSLAFCPYASEDPFVCTRPLLRHLSRSSSDNGQEDTVDGRTSIFSKVLAQFGIFKL
ncbi:hypothetical protein NEOLEDRAFT_1150911 [Neolentinus lepideus HHB14362 ss-1]|uniref:Uncharacterized protein n=1 Tax=Neolentinus lepideus HHB14362 ss-1 TaxID=1314782 RepID=A0A165PHW0_9AGAM|nr:hypothetical protein NEOLEDRAFT_1150911 [Neolentinus lepideus HHB14362 ss-1]